MLINAQSANPSKLTVGLAGLAVSQDPNVSLCTAPLGAGLGVAIYDPTVKVGGLLHSLLPSSSMDPGRAASCPAMFIDTGLTALLAAAQQLNATRENLRVCVAGAAQIMDHTSFFNPGKCNYDSLTELLPQLGIKVYAEDVWARNNCSMELDLATGGVLLRYTGQATTKTLCKP